MVLKAMKECSGCQRCRQNGRTLLNGLFPHRGQVDRASLQRPGVEPPATPPPAGFLPPLLRGGCGGTVVRGPRVRVYPTSWLTRTFFTSASVCIVRCTGHLS